MLQLASQHEITNYNKRESFYTHVILHVIHMRVVELKQHLNTAHVPLKIFTMGNERVLIVVYVLSMENILA